MWEAHRRTVNGEHEVYYSKNHLGNLISIIAADTENARWTVKRISQEKFTQRLHQIYKN